MATIQKKKKSICVTFPPSQNYTDRLRIPLPVHLHVFLHSSPLLLPLLHTHKTCHPSLHDLFALRHALYSNPIQFDCQPPSRSEFLPPCTRQSILEG